LRFLIYNFGLLYSKRTADDMSIDDESMEDSVEDDIKDMVETKEKIKDLVDRGIVERIEHKDPVSVKDFNAYGKIKEEYSSFFEDEEGEGDRQGSSITDILKEITDYLEEEIKTMGEGSLSEDNLKGSLSEDSSKRSKLSDSGSTEKEPKDYPTEMPPF
jgi:hypothetical protein